MHIHLNNITDTTKSNIKQGLGVSVRFQTYTIHVGTKNIHIEISRQVKSEVKERLSRYYSIDDVKVGRLQDRYASFRELCSELSVSEALRREKSLAIFIFITHIPSEIVRIRLICQL